MQIIIIITIISIITIIINYYLVKEMTLNESCLFLLPNSLTFFLRNIVT